MNDYPPCHHTADTGQNQCGLKIGTLIHNGKCQSWKLKKAELTRSTGLTVRIRIMLMRIRYEVLKFKTQRCGSGFIKEKKVFFFTDRTWNTGSYKKEIIMLK